MQARKRAQEFAQLLLERYGEDLVSVVLYGSAARGDYREGISDLNVLVLLRTLNPELLRRGTEITRAWAEEGNPPPLMFSEAEWHTSADVFPIEFGDIGDAHIVLHGIDPFEGMEIDWEHLRLQCEHELKSKQIQLREQYMLHATDANAVGQLLTHSFPTFLTLFRAALRVAGAEAPREPEAAITGIAARAEFDPASFLEVHRARSTKASFKPAADDPVVTGYLTAVARAAAWLDQLPTPPVDER